MKDYYKILQVHPEASLDVMNNAYRTLVRQYHPDLYHTHRKDHMNDKMREINEAYQVLSNPHTRADYDRQYHTLGHNNASPQPSNPAITKTSLMRMLLWGIGTYITLKFLILPLLTNPALKLLFLIGFAYLLFRLYGRPKPKPPQS
jgi:curved DNA-binding protein CbpA